METEQTKTPKGTSAFLDIFRRADKNDDGALSWDEFKSFFADGVLSDDELSNLFHEIDTHNTNNIDTGELCSFFSNQLGPFQEIFSAIEDLNNAVTKSLTQSAQDYPQSSFTQQFLTRFTLREVVKQLTAVQRPIDAAADILEENALSDRKDIPQASLKSSGSRPPIDVIDGKSDMAASDIVPGRFARRAMRQLSTQTSWTADAGYGMAASASLSQQVERLRVILDRMENKINFDHITDEKVDATHDKLLLIVSRKLTVEERNEKALRNSIRSYVEGTDECEDCLHLSVRNYAGNYTFMIYEIWDSQDSWKSYQQSPVCRAFQHSKVDYLETQEQVSTLQFPESWWRRE